MLSVVSSGNAEAGAGGDIITTECYSNFELQADFMITTGCNSGIKIFVQPNLSPIDKVTGKPTGVGSAIGLEYQILDDAHHPDAKLGRNGDRKLGALYDLFPCDPDKTVYPPGQWNHAYILSRGTHVEHWLNGKKILEYDRGSDAFREAVALSKFKNIPDFGEWPQGHILLQEHGSQVFFRNIKIHDPAGKLMRRVHGLDETTNPAAFSPITESTAPPELAVLPNLLPARVSGAGMANRKIQVAQIGCGAWAATWKYPDATGRPGRGGCDVDRKRCPAGQAMAEDYYRQRGESSVSIKSFHDYREILASPEIDAVVISVPDHAHALTAIEAAIAGKAVYVQKPVTYSIAEAIGLRRAVEAKRSSCKRARSSVPVARGEVSGPPARPCATGARIGPFCIQAQNRLRVWTNPAVITGVRRTGAAQPGL